jgi:hypothetical protein
MWQKVTLTTAAPTAKVSFAGRGSVYAEGTFGAGIVGLYVTYTNPTTGVVSVSTGYLDSAIDGTLVKTIDCPAGEYQLSLTGSVGATVDVYYNDQKVMSINN